MSVVQEMSKANTEEFAVSSFEFDAQSLLQKVHCNFSFSLFVASLTLRFRKPLGQATKNALYS